jgi:adenine-specific DNA methylase
MIWDLYQQQQIATAGRTADRAISKAERHANHIEELQQHVERLSLASQAMWEILRDRAEITEADLETKILEIDARDGRIDGKINTQPVNCPSCGRTTSSRRNTCVMCGAPTRRLHQFEG